MKKWIKISFMATLFSSMNVAYADSLPQRFEGCFMMEEKMCLFKDGTAISETQYTDKADYSYQTYTLLDNLDNLDNLDKFEHTEQALKLKSIFALPTFALYEGKNPNLSQDFHLTLFQFNKGYSQDEIIVDGKKLNFTTATSNPKRPDEIQFVLANTPKQVVLKKFVKDKLYYTYTYQLNHEFNQVLINSYNAISGDVDFPITYQDGKLTMDFGKWGKHPFPFVSPSEAGTTWQEFAKIKAVKQRLADYDKAIYIDKNGWYTYQRDWLNAEEIENKLTNEQSAQLSQEIDEKLKNAGLIKLDFLAPVKTQSAVR